MNKHWTYGALLSIAVLVTACGGGSNSVETASNGGTGNGGTTTPTPAPMTAMDTFIQAVTALIANLSDTTEPSALDATPASAPEDKEPASVS